MLGDLKTGISYETSSNFDILTHYQTGWNVTKCHACHAKRHDNFVRNPVEPDLALHQSLPEPSPEPSPEPTWLCTKASRNFLWNLLRNLVELPWKPSKRRGFAASPIDTATPQEHQGLDETRGSTKTIIWYETSGDFHSWQHDKRTSFAASPINTARPRANQRRETRQVGAPK